MIPRTTGTTAVLARITAVAILGAGAAACSQSSSSPPPTAATTSTVTPASTSTTTTVAPTTTASTNPSTSPSTTGAPTTAPPSTEPTVTEPPSTTEPPVIRELILREDGLGSATFGAEPDGVIEYVTSFLGAPTADTDWTEPDEFALCPGAEVRRVEWGVLRLGFGDVSAYANGRRHVYSWQYGLDGQIGGEPQGLRTEEGISLGSLVVDLRAAYPDAELYEGDEELFPPGFELGDDFFGFLTGLDDDDAVTEMFGGYFCGE